VITDLLFVYGTLRSDSGHAMHAELARVADLVGKAVFRGRLYRVRHYPGAVGSDDPADRVHGEVYRLHGPARAIPALDEYEGYEPGFASSGFERVQADVALASRDTVRAWIYVYRKPTRGLTRIVSGDFLGAP
jgi:gamma-glutamylcyclotransferase (GGCT)/AIG2-like uncharacterized protein YtfP